eukprot:15444408-Alexandrium_andersonii.AAC.1
MGSPTPADSKQIAWVRRPLPHPYRIEAPFSSLACASWADALSLPLHVLEQRTVGRARVNVNYSLLNRMNGESRQHAVWTRSGCASAGL